MTETLILTRAAAEEFAIPFLLDAGLPEADAAIAARCLVRADLRGVDTHGMVRLPGYLDRIAKGLVDPAPRLDFEAVAPMPQGSMARMVWVSSWRHARWITGSIWRARWVWA